MLRNVPDAEDVVATAIARVLRRARSHPIDNLEPYLRTAVANEVKSKLRWRQSHWVASGDYDRIIADITAGDPDIATQ